MQFLGLLPGNTSFGSRVGGDIGKVLGNSLQSIANHKVQSLENRQKERTLIQGGLDPQFAKQLSTQPLDFIQNVLKGLEGFGTPGAAPQQNYSQNQPYQQQNMGQNQPSNNPKQSPVDINGLVEQAYQQYPQLQGQVSPEQLGQILQNQAHQQALNPIDRHQQQYQSGGVVPKGYKPSVVPGQNDQVKIAQQKSQEIIDRGQEAQRRLKVLKEYAHILNTEKVTGGTAFNLAKATGSGALFQTTGSEKLSKLSEQLLPKTDNQQELLSAQRKVPNPGQSIQAQRALVKDAIKNAQEEVKRAKITDDILNKNGGIAPIGIDRLVDKKLGINSDYDQAPEGYTFGKEINASDLYESDYPEGTRADFPDGSQKEFVNGNWVSI